MGFPGGTIDKEPACQSRRHKRHRFDPWVGKIPWRRHSNALQYSCLENPMDRGAWQATVHRVTQSWTQLKQLSIHTHTCVRTHTQIPKNKGSTVDCRSWKHRKCSVKVSLLAGLHFPNGKDQSHSQEPPNLSICDLVTLL